MIVDFSYIRDDHTRNIIESCYRAVITLELMSWVRSVYIDSKESCTYVNNPTIKRICKEMESQSKVKRAFDPSLELAMRHIGFIAKHGIDEHKRLFL